MSIDTSQLQFSITGPYRHSDGSFKFDVVVLNYSLVNTVPDVVALASCHVKTDKVCHALAEALRSVADQLPPDLRNLP